MNDIIFEYNGIVYSVVYKNDEIIIYKLNNGNYVLLNDKEQENIKKMLYSQYSYIYNSEYLDYLVSKNVNIENKAYLSNFLLWLENLIPIGCRSNFYRNISTLKTKLNINCKENELDHFSNSIVSGGYDTMNNLISIREDKISDLHKIANLTSNPENFFWVHYSQTLLHELVHMSSSNFNCNNSVSLCGFDVYPPTKIENQNRGLTEGFTELISMAGVPGTVEMASGYYVEASIVSQMILLVGPDVFLKSFFSNLGISELKLKFQELINDPDKIYQLFRQIELNFQIRNLDDKQNVLGNIQSTLLDYLEVKIKKIYEEGDFKTISNIFNMYEQFLITPDKLKLMGKNPKNYLGLSLSLDEFMNLKKAYLDRFDFMDDMRDDKKFMI